MTIARAMQLADSTDPRKYISVMSKLDFDGVTAKIKFDSKGDLQSSHVTLFSYKGQKKAPL